MAEVGELFNLYDHAKMFGPDGKMLEVVKVLDQNSPILHDAVTIESNSDNGHIFAKQNGVAEVAFRRAYQGVKPTKGSRTVVTAGYGRASSVCEVDVAVAEKGGKVSEIRAEMAAEHIERMTEELDSKIIYGSRNPDEKAFVGFAAQYSDVNAENGRQITLMDQITPEGESAPIGATGNVSSIYFVGWGKGKIFTFYPKGTRAGIKTYDFSKNGPIDLKDENGGTYPGYKEQFEALMGFCVQDWRYGARLANIDVQAIQGSKAKKIALYEAFMTTLGKIKNIANVKLVCYASREVKDLLRSGYMAAGGVTVFQNNNMTSSGNQGYGAADLVIDGIHIKAADCISNDEEKLAA